MTKPAIKVAVVRFYQRIPMHFIKLAITQYETNGAWPAIGADDKWINLDQVVIIEEHLGSNSFDASVRAGIAAVEHYPCIQLTMSDGQTHLVSLGITSTQVAGTEAITNFMPILISPVVPCHRTAGTAVGLVDCNP